MLVTLDFNDIVLANAFSLYIKMHFDYFLEDGNLAYL